jgi:hypothetical protein
MRALHGFAAAGLWCVTAVTVSAVAQDIAAAEAFFNRGFADMQAGRYEAGCKAIAESHRLDPRPGTLFTLAVCEAKWGRIATAAARYSDYLSLYEQLTPTEKARQKDRPKQAKAQREALAPLVPELTLVLPPRAPEGTVVQRDGAVVAEAALGVALPVDPGEHVLTTQARGGEITEIHISLGKGEKRHITLLVKEAKAAAPPPSDQGPRPAPAPPAPLVYGRRVGAYVAGGVGAAGLILGGVMGALTLGKKAAIQQHCNLGGDKRACDAEGFAAASDAKTLGLVSTVGFGVGIAGVGAAIALLVTEPRSPKNAAAPPNRVSAGVLSAGREGASVGILGAW